jgi:hypothetical protein
LDGLGAVLEPTTLIVRSRFVDGDLTLVAPLREGDDRHAAVADALTPAQARVVRVDDGGSTNRPAELHHTRAADQMTLQRAACYVAGPARAARPGRCVLLLAEQSSVEPLLAAASGRSPVHLAAGLVGGNGPGLFFPLALPPSDSRDRDELLPAAALLLRAGLGRTAAAEELDERILSARRRSVDALDRAARGSLAGNTRAFVDAVLGLLPAARRDSHVAFGGSA